MKQCTNTRLICAKGNAVPDWMLVFQEGEVSYDDLDSILVDETAFKLIKAEFERRGNDIVVDYEHQTLDGKEAPAAGWIKELKYERGSGIMAKVEWTARAKEYISAKEYRYFSPVFLVRKVDRRPFELNNVALTNSPRTNNLTPIVAKTLTKEQIKIMDITKIIELLGLSADATEADVLAKVSELLAKADEPTAASTNEEDPEAGTVAEGISQAETQLETVIEAATEALTEIQDVKDEVLDQPVVSKALLKALGLKEGTNYRSVVASVYALQQRAGNGNVVQRLAKLEADQKAAHASMVVAKALQSGKITPVQKPWATSYALNDPKGFDEFVAKAPQVVPLDRLSSYVTKATSRDSGFDESIAAKFGVTKEDDEKYGRK